MEEDNQEDYQSQLSNRQNYNPQIISIRKRLAAPNSILPGNMMRSGMSHHLLPIKPELASKPGFQMPLDSAQWQSQMQARKRPYKGGMMKQNEKKSKSELSHTKNAQNMRTLRSNSPDLVLNNNLLDFLNNNVRNILKYPTNIVFISPLLFLSHLDPPYSPYSHKKHHNQQLKSHQNKLSFIKMLQNNKNFPSVCYDHRGNTNSLKVRQIDAINNESDDLIFNDNFESSNILLSFKYTKQLNKNVSDQQFKMTKQEQLYIVMTRFDYNTRSYGQWFYFQIKRRQSLNHHHHHHHHRSGPNSKMYTFMIVNMTKDKTMFSKGLKISVCRNGVWRKQGVNIKYYKNSLRRQQTSQFLNEQFVEDQYLNNYANSTIEYFYTLQFGLEIFQGQDVYVAYNEPYTYSRLGKLLDKIIDKYESNSANVINLKRHRIVEKTYLSNHIDTITFSAKQRKSQTIPTQQKKVIVIMGRTHPIQTAGSHVIQGILNQIYKSFIENPEQTSTNSILYKLLEHYIIKIIPMVNPDGVIVGNTRCNMNGYDLNRCWRLTKEDRCREIYHIKNHILEYQERIQMCIDLHAHSKKKNVFAYGCHDNSNPFATRQFPYLLSKVSQKDFLYQECQFTKMSDLKNNKNKKISKNGTARIFLYDTLKIPNVFTIQNSYCSAKGSSFHYDEQAYQNIGADILKAIALYFLPFYKQQNTFLTQSKNEKQYKNEVALQLNTRYTTTDLSLNMSVDKKQDYLYQAKQYRYNVIKQLHADKSNVTLGLVKYCSVSDSQEQKRINQVSQATFKKQRNLSEIELKKKTKKSNISSINGDYRQVQGTNHTSNKPTTTRQILNNSSTHSETTLAKAYKIAQNRFKTVGQQMIIPPTKYDFLNAERDKRPLMAISKPSKQKMEQTKRRPHLTVIDIGGNRDLQKIRQQKQLVLRPQSKQRITSVNQIISNKLQQLNGDNIKTKKDDQIKQYFRTIIKKKIKFNPFQKRHDNSKRQKTIKDILQKKQRAMDLKESQIIFNGMILADKQAQQSIIIQDQQKFPQNMEKKLQNNQFANNKISKFKSMHNKSLIKFNDYSLKNQNSNKISKSPNALVSDLRISKLVSLKNSTYFQKYSSKKQKDIK